VPLELGGTRNSSISVLAYERLKAHLGIAGPTRLLSKQGQVADVNDAVRARFGIDTRPLHIRPPERWQDAPLPDDAFGDEWGVVWRRPPGMNSFFLLRSPFEADATPEAVRCHRWPDPADPGRVRGLAEEARRLSAETSEAVVFDSTASFLGEAEWLRGFAGFYTDLITNPPFVHALLDKVLEIKLAMLAPALDAVGGHVDVVLAGDDLGTQHAPMISPAMYREFVRPRQAVLFDFLRRRGGGAKLLYHCDGAIGPFIPDLIALGIDALNPVQVSAAGMGDTARLKREYGKDLCFWGGVDTAHVLPFGTAQEVRDEVRRRIEDLAPGGGYVLGAVHNIQPEVPPENICALFDAALAGC
jgi:uroporphyrinogen decarboxylase